MILNSWQCFWIVILKTSIAICYDEEDPYVDITSSNPRDNRFYPFREIKSVTPPTFDPDKMFNENHYNELMENSRKLNEIRKYMDTNKESFNFPNWNDFVVPTFNYDEIHHKYSPTDEWEHDEKKEEDELNPIWRIISGILSRGRAKNITFMQFLFGLAIYIGLVCSLLMIIFCMHYLRSKCRRKKTQDAEVNENSLDDSDFGQQQLV